MTILTQSRIYQEDISLAQKAAFPISDDNDFQVHRKQGNVSLLNSFSLEEILAWHANLEIKTIFNTYKAYTYVHVSPRTDRWISEYKAEFSISDTNDLQVHRKPRYSSIFNNLVLEKILLRDINLVI